MKVNVDTIKIKQAHLDQNTSQCIVSQCLLVSDGDLERSKSLGPALGPVLLALYLGPLHQVRYHDNGGGPLLPDQPPEVNHCLW